MPTIKISVESLTLLAEEAHELGVSVKDVADMVIHIVLGQPEEKEEGPEEGEGKEEEEEEEEG